MTFLLDTNACIGWLRNSEPKLVARIKEEDPADVMLCSVVIGELLFGVERSNHVHRAANQSRLDRLRAQFRSRPFNDDAAQFYGKARAQLTSSGQMIGANDLLIAAIALANRLTLVTHNTHEFGRISGLKLENWQ